MGRFTFWVAVVCVAEGHSMVARPAVHRLTFLQPFPVYCASAAGRCCCSLLRSLLRLSLSTGLLLRSTWDGCNFIPEDLHPKSFRGSIGHNTNVWAVRDRAGMPVSGPVGVFAMEQVTSTHHKPSTPHCLSRRHKKDRICEVAEKTPQPATRVQFQSPARFVVGQARCRLSMRVHARA